MDIKTIRRNFYKNKLYLSGKFDDQYTSERLQQDLQHLLNEFIPNATLKQLTKFMDKKFSRILKTFPFLQKPLKKVIKDKLNKIPVDMKKQQEQKLFKRLRQKFPTMELIKKENVQNQYEFISKDKFQDNCKWNFFNFEDIRIAMPVSTSFIWSIHDKNTPNGYCKLVFQNQENWSQEYLALTTQIVKQTFDVKRGNFERQANKLLEKFNAFNQSMKNIEESQE